MKRLDEIDFLRGICIIYMVMGHIPFGYSFDHYIHAFHMPVFFVMSGFFLKRDKSVNMLDLFKKLIKKLILPYLFFGLIFLVFADLTKYGLNDTPKQYLINLFTYNDTLVIAGALWFLTSFFFASIIFNLLNKIKNEYIFGLLSILFLVIGVYFNNIFEFKLILSLQSSFVGVGLMYIGYLLNKIKLINKITTDNVVVIVLMFIINCFFIMKTDYVNMRTSIYPNVLMFLLNIIFSIILYISIGKLFKNRFNNIYEKVCYFGQYSIFSLCLNQFIILIVNVIFNKFNIIVLLKYNLIINFVTTVITLFLIYMLTKLILRTKFKLLFGK